VPPPPGEGRRDGLQAHLPREQTGGSPSQPSASNTAVTEQRKRSVGPKALTGQSRDVLGDARPDARSGLFQEAAARFIAADVCLDFGPQHWVARCQVSNAVG